MNRYVNKANPAVQSSADVMVPIVIDLIQPQSVIDAGCGQGHWVKAFLDNGITDALGIDMAYHVPQLIIPRGNFEVRDLTKDFALNRKWDLSVCLEVGEHLPAHRALPLVKLLTESADAVLFGASIPHQGGGVHHVNEQWQDYWAKLFYLLGYIPFDFRRLTWNDKRVLWFYSENTFLYVRESQLANYPRLANFKAIFPLNVVHPEAFRFTFKRVLGIILSELKII